MHEDVVEQIGSSIISNGGAKGDWRSERIENKTGHRILILCVSQTSLAVSTAWRLNTRNGVQ